MRTDFSPEQLVDPRMAQSEAAIRKCVHCGFCTATCPTYVLLGNELDSPRGRITLMKDMLEQGRMPDAATVRHVDRCLSCLSCRTTCPSDVDYMRLVDHARAYIHEHYRRPWPQRLMRALLAGVLPHPRRFAAMIRLGWLARPLAPLLARMPATAPLAEMLRLVPDKLPRSERGETPLAPNRRGRVVVLRGCADRVLQPQVRAATTSLLARLGFATAGVAAEGCCGSLVHHLGREEAAKAAARQNIDAWWPLVSDAADPLRAIIVTSSGCGLMVKDYGHVLANDPGYATRAERVAALARDVNEFVLQSALPPIVAGRALKVAFQCPCSLQHGQRLPDAGLRLLKAAGFEVRTPRDAHLCCGSAGTYNILQPEIAEQLAARKARTLEELDADVIATANVGCAIQIGQATRLPVVHVVELIEWAAGGVDPRPAATVGRPAP